MKGHQKTLNCWVTGASSGLGREIVLQLAKKGHRVYATARDAAALDALSAAYPACIVPLACDVTDEQAMSGLLAQAEGLQHLDVLILSAGICEYVDVPDIDTSLIRRVMETNFFGAVNACKAALPWLKKAVGSEFKPRIIGISSLSTVTGFPRNEAYGSSKAAFEYFLDALRCDIGHQIQITTVRPGFIQTALTAKNDFPMPFLMQADEAANQVVSRVEQGRLRFAFPWQLDWMLGTARMFPRLWYGPVMRQLLQKSRTNT